MSGARVTGGDLAVAAKAAADAAGELERLVVRARADGMLLREICAATGLTHPTVLRWVARHADGQQARSQRHTTSRQSI